jgi:hypothetical protein
VAANLVPGIVISKKHVVFTVLIFIVVQESRWVICYIKDCDVIGHQRRRTASRRAVCRCSMPRNQFGCVQVFLYLPFLSYNHKSCNRCLPLLQYLMNWLGGWPSSLPPQAHVPLWWNQSLGDGTTCIQIQSNTVVHPLGIYSTEITLVNEVLPLAENFSMFVTTEWANQMDQNIMFPGLEVNHWFRYDNLTCIQRFL